MSASRHLVLLACLLGAACSKKAPEPTAAPAPAPSVAAETKHDVVGADGKLDPNDPRHGTRRLMGLDAPVYVDGAQVAVLRFGEMPPIAPVKNETGADQYRLYDYLKGIGIAPETVKSVHLHGNGDKIASVEGKELLKEKNRFVFSYLSGDTGTPMQRWSSTGLKNEFVIHEIRRVTVYVQKPVPAIHAQKQCHVDPAGECTDTIPYAANDGAKGTRVYLDGKMVGHVKRRQITDAMLAGPAMPDSSENVYGVAKLVAAMGVDPASLSTVELVAGDDVIAREAGADFASKPLTFSLPKHHHGKVTMHVPGEIQAGAASAARDGLVSAVLLYKNTTPAKRELVAISEDTDTSVLVATVEDTQGRGRGQQ